MVSKTISVRMIIPLEEGFETMCTRAAPKGIHGKDASLRFHPSQDLPIHEIVLLKRLTATQIAERSAFPLRLRHRQHTSSSPVHTQGVKVLNTKPSSAPK
jgi:hypothetical protein